MRIGSLEVLHAVFQSPISDKSRYVVGVDDMDYLNFAKTFNITDVQHAKATGVNIDGEESKFFLCYLEDCFDPVCAIVRADDASDAEQRFVDECEWAQVSDADADEERDTEDADCPYNYSDNGIRYDGELLMVLQVKCLYIVPDNKG